MPQLWGNLSVVDLVSYHCRLYIPLKRAWGGIQRDGDGFGLQDMLRCKKNHGSQPPKTGRPNQRHFLCLEVSLDGLKSPHSGAFLANHTQLLPPPTASFMPHTERTASHSARSERIIDQFTSSYYFGCSALHITLMSQ